MPTPARKPTAPPATEDDPFKYGWRYVKRTLPNGSTELEQVPLSLEDVLHPEEEDFHIHNKQHERDRSYLTDVLESLPLTPPLVEVTSDLRIDWGVKGLRAHGPDVAVFVGMTTKPHVEAGTLYLANTGGKCILAVEVVSPSTRTNDVGPKLEHYHRAQVGFYAIVDQENEFGPRRLLGYEWRKRAFKKAKLRRDGTLVLPLVGLGLQLHDNELICVDSATKQRHLRFPTMRSELTKADHKIQEQDNLLEESSLTNRALEKELLVERAARRRAEGLVQELRQIVGTMDERLRRIEARERS